MLTFSFILFVALLSLLYKQNERHECKQNEMFTAEQVASNKNDKCFDLIILFLFFLFSQFLRETKKNRIKVFEGPPLQP